MTGQSRFCLTLIALATAFLLILYVRAAPGPPVDFGAYYGAATDLQAGRSPYRDALAWKAADHATGSPGPPPTAAIAYVYPPALALAIAPLTLLPLAQASAVWLALLFGCVVGTSCCLASLVLAPGIGPRATSDTASGLAPAADLRSASRDHQFWLLVALLAVAIALFKPVRGALTFSRQVDPLLLFLLSATIVAFVRRRDGLAGLLLGLAISIKPFLVVLALVPLWKGAYRVVIVAGVVSAALVLGPLLQLGLLAEFREAASHWAGPTMAASPVGQSAYSLLLRTLTVQPYTAPLLEAPWLVVPLHWLLGAGLVGLLLARIPRRRDLPPLTLALEWSLAVTAMLIFGPLTEEHHLAYLAPGLLTGLAVGLTRWTASTTARRLAILTTLVTVVLMLPGTQAIAWGFYAYQVGPIAPPASFATFFWLVVLLGAGALNLVALQLLHREPPAARAHTAPP